MFSLKQVSLLTIASVQTICRLPGTVHYEPPGKLPKTVFIDEFKGNTLLLCRPVSGPYDEKMVLRHLLDRVLLLAVKI
jgi:hypothetical protein